MHDDYFNRTFTVKDYIYCEQCKELVDLWKYDSIENTGHESCNWRYVTQEELEVCIHDCIENGCFEEAGIHPYWIRLPSNHIDGVKFQKPDKSGLLEKEEQKVIEDVIAEFHADRESREFFCR